MLAPFLSNLYWWRYVLIAAFITGFALGEWGFGW